MSDCPERIDEVIQLADGQHLVIVFEKLLIRPVQLKSRKVEFLLLHLEIGPLERIVDLGIFLIRLFLVIVPII